MIKTEPKRGLQSPYSRIIFGLSVSDVLFSLGMLLSPFLAPSSLSLAPFALGNGQSCEFAGYLNIAGAAAIPTYTLFLTYYFMRRIKYKVSPQKFSGLEEKIWHATGILVPVGFATAALSMGDINSYPNGTMCFLASEPYNCNDTGNKCNRGENVAIFTITFGATGIALFIFLMVVLYMFTHHVYSIEKDFRIPASSTPTRKRESNRHLNFMLNRQEPNQDSDSNTSGRESTNASKSIFALSNIEINRTPSSGQEEAQSSVMHDVNLSHNQNPPQEGSDETDTPSPRELSKKALNQSLLYIFAFLLFYIPGMVQVILCGLNNNAKDSRVFLWWSSTLYPTGGVWNILIYTRPKCQKLQKDVPGLTYIAAFILVVLNGGEVPSLTDLGIDAVREPDSYTGKQEENFDEQHQQNYLEEREILHTQMKVNLDDLSSFMRSMVGIDSIMEKNQLENENMDEYDMFFLDLDTSIGPSQLENCNVDSRVLSEGEIGTSEWDDPSSRNA
ncbi:hypothetical protein CTEN210_06527 [Chaetoceros tenuissimus]|uniref:G-protein coupled receptors family 1 profile domain-containing protein n=1 Tax=Chaetoceros tenuissimus TaxID=426638 RepID=A0AAD3CQ15_9STRA|nr:hypothetical protein CTEN210_06527 [Chaetoceros tenuissimus]